MTIFLIVVAAVHALFMICELFPWASPLLLGIVSKKLTDLPAGVRGTESPKWSKEQQPLVATIVHNAGIYNGIVAGGLMWAAVTGDVNVARVMLAGAAVAGIFGTATLKSPVTAVQALLGIAGLFLLNRS
jgi:putative membrane protein